MIEPSSFDWSKCVAAIIASTKDRIQGMCRQANAKNA